jgi:YVTN family beta-propeller protein
MSTAVIRTSVLIAILVAPGASHEQGGSSPLLLVLNKDEATLSFITSNDGKTVGRVPTGQAPHEVAVSRDGRLAFVTNYGTGPAPGATISVIDVPARKEVRRIDLGALRRPHGIASAAGKAFFTAEANRAVAAYDPAADRIDWILGTGQAATHMVLVNDDASRLFTANIGSNTVSLLERGANALAWEVTQIPVGQGPEGMDRSPDGSQVWAAHSRDGGVSIIDVSQKKVVATIDAGTKRSNRLKFTPDGRRVLISDLDGGTLVVIDVPGRKVVKRMPLGRSPEGILIVPDGSRAYVAVTGENYVAVVDLTTLEVTGRVTTGQGPDGMAWVSSSGSLLP